MMRVQLRAILLLAALLFTQATSAADLRVLNCPQLFSEGDSGQLNHKKTIDDAILFGANRPKAQPGQKPSLASQSDFTKGSFSERFFTLSMAGKLLSQDDPRLVKEKLAFSDHGGICGPTCIANIINTAMALSPNPRTADEILTDFFANYKKLERADGRVSTFPDGLIAAAKALPEFANADVVPIPQGAGSADLFNQLLHIEPQGKEGSITSAVEFPNGEGHVIEILNIDTTAKAVWIGDPNYPNRVYHTPYHESTDANSAKVFELLLVGQYDAKDPNDTQTWVRFVQGFDINWKTFANP